MINFLINALFIFILAQTGRFTVKTPIEHRAYFKKKFLKYFSGENFDEKFKKFAKLEKLIFYATLLMLIIFNTIEFIKYW